MTDTTASPSGAIPRVQAQWSHREFLEAVEPPYAMINLVHARRLVKRGETAASYFPAATEVIVTSTVADEKLALISWEDERDIIREFAPTYHIPTDYPVYGDDPPDARYENIKDCMTGTLWMADHLSDTETTILPLVKGYAPAERQLCYQVAEELSAPLSVFYATQYFTNGQGIRIDTLINDLQTITDESTVELLVIGLLSPHYLTRLPENVIAAAGLNQWRQAVTPRKQSPAGMQDAYTSIATEVSAALASSARD